MDHSKITLEERIEGSLWGMFIGDSLAMPVHWYYDRSRIRQDFGQITKYEAPKQQYVGSIMNLSNTGGGGRGSDQGSIVGDVILHGKKKYWLKGGNYHYHHGMSAGDNTLDALVARQLIQSLIEKKGLDIAHYRDKYITFMTTPDSHNDIYAGTCHRMFFANRAKGIPVEKCADNDGHNVDAIDGLINVIPVTLAFHKDSELQKKVTSTILVLRNSEILPSYAEIYSQLLLKLLNGEGLKESVDWAGKQVGINIPLFAQKNTEDPMTACYIDSSFPAMLYFAYKYGDDPEKCLLRSANAGGENVNRSNILGALLGAHHGFKAWPKSLVEGLTKSNEYKQEFLEFINIFCPK